MDLGFNSTQHDRNRLSTLSIDQRNTMYITDDPTMSIPTTNSRSTHHNIHNQHQWICPVCSMTFLTVFYLREHMRTHQNLNETQQLSNNMIIETEKHACAECNKSFETLSELETHMATHLSTPALFCKECGKSFWLSESQEMHVCSHLKFNSTSTTSSLKSLKVQTCNICSKTFRNASYFQLHMRMHAGDNTYSCDMCDKIFSCSWNLKTHLAVHKDDKPFNCTLCGVGFKLKANMQRHERSHLLSKLPNATLPENGDGYVEKKNYACSICGMRFKVKANVIRHERLHNVMNSAVEKEKKNDTIELKPAIKPQVDTSRMYKCLSSVVANRHACKVCGKTYKQRCHLLSHLLSHSDAQPYVCELCGKSFSLAWNLKTHLAVHNQEKPFSCTICGSNFKLKTALQRHERSHLTVKMADRQLLSEQFEPVRSSGNYKELQCPGCDKKYLTFSELRSHMEVHNDPECFLCNRCGMDFSCLDDLRRHLDACKCIGKGFGCNVCNRKFSSALELQIHRQIHS